jgi:uncharacterized protein DUF6893
VRTLGIITTVVGAGVLAAAVVIGVLSVPDVKRYLEIRRMLAVTR